MQRSPVKYHGGKYYLARWIISHFPAHTIYVEPYGGGASVLLNKTPSETEVYNDLEPGIYSLFYIIKNDFERLLNVLQMIDCREEVFLAAKEKLKTSLETFDLGLNTLILRRMSRGAYGQVFSWSKRLTVGGVVEEENAWITMKEKELHKIHDRIKNIQIYNKDAIEIIKQFDSPDTLFYLDPPYVRETRTSLRTVGAWDYLKEMSKEQHIQLAETLNQIQGKAIISGYPSDLYNSLYASWKKDSKLIPNHAAQKKKKQVQEECLWLTF